MPEVPMLFVDIGGLAMYREDGSDKVEKTRGVAQLFPLSRAWAAMGRRKGAGALQREGHQRHAQCARERYRPWSASTGPNAEGCSLR
eukprot:5804828-Heterocapsa_arctica.AAC.1